MAVNATAPGASLAPGLTGCAGKFAFNAMATLLLVDDDSDSLWLLRLTLESRGHAVVVASDGQAGLEKCAHHRPDLIVTDWNMPRMDGVALCERLKSYPALAMIPVILASGENPPPGKAFLWTRFLRKPVDVDELAATIDSLVAKRLCSVPTRRLGGGASMRCRRPGVPQKYWA
ncbi:MAG TPA: response regulator [Paraburkholderia sp.]|jgi:CheY-like chemotaxis protein|nr:response regulator [Paraburkholderia sp.]